MPDAEVNRLFLEEAKLLRAEVGYGELGLRGKLGYEDLSVSVGAKHYEHALSAHAPSAVTFELDGSFASFRCHVALNDEVAARSSHADFTVIADGRIVAAMPNVMAGDAPRELEADISHAKRLTLLVDTNRFPLCHSVWLDPQVSEQPHERPTGTMTDCLARAWILLPDAPLKANRCVATVVSPGYAALLDDMLGSFYANSNCADALVIVFALNADEECRKVIDKHGATTIHCSPLGPVNPTLKSVMYSMARVVDAQQFLCLDADMLILDDLNPIFDAFGAFPPDSIFVARDGFLNYGTLEEKLISSYEGRTDDLRLLLSGSYEREGAYPLLVNDGLFAGSYGAFCALDNLIRNMPQAIDWVDALPHHGWRNQFIFNLALARLNCGVEIDPIYNLQVDTRDALMSWAGEKMHALWRGQSARVLHFRGWGRNNYPEWRGHFARASEQIAGKQETDEEELQPRLTGELK
jgi:NPCBM/NEW2 domain